MSDIDVEKLRGLVDGAITANCEMGKAKGDALAALRAVQMLLPLPPKPEPAKGPYKVAYAANNRWNVYVEGYPTLATADEPTARLLAASWAMWEFIKDERANVNSHWQKRIDDTFKEYGI